MPDSSSIAATRRLTAYGVITRLPGFDDVVTVDDIGIKHDDGGGNWLRIAVIGGRPIAWGFDAETDDEITLPADVPVGDGEDDVNVFAEAAAGSPADVEILTSWLTDDAALTESLDWLSQWLDDTHPGVAAPEWELAAVITDPFAAGVVERLAARVPDARTDGIAEFLAAAHRISHR